MPRLVENLKKTYYYLKKNGLEDTFYAVWERMESRKGPVYDYIAPKEDVLEKQGKEVMVWMPKLSLVVPAYETQPLFMQDLILSVVEQSYPNYELVIADASESDVVERTVRDFQSQYGGIVYHRLESNGGISENTNAALPLATGDYIGLLDHDDLLTPDALYYIAKEINHCRKKGLDPELFYTDEDKTDTHLEKYYEPNQKPDFNYNMALTNNYVCHLSFYRADVIRALGLRKEYDGAQDYDLLLRTMAFIENSWEKQDGSEMTDGKGHTAGKGKNGGCYVNWSEHIRHIPHILYHWRCHEASTAANPQSKTYAYEAGKRAVEDYLLKKWESLSKKEERPEFQVKYLKHLGFYRVEYESGSLFKNRPDLGVIGGPIYTAHKVSGGAMKKNGTVLYGGLREHFSGDMHRAVLQQDVEAVDIRNMVIRKDLIHTFEKITGYSYPMDPELCTEKLSENELDKIRKKSLEFCNKVRNQSIGIMYDPVLRIGNDSDRE